MTAAALHRDGLRFECLACGACCRNHGEYTYVYVMPRDVAAMSAHLRMSAAELEARYLAEEEGWTFLRTDEEACPFLDGNRCRVYPVRPKQCVTWPFWHENLVRETWEGPVAACCPGVGRGPLHDRSEIERLVRERADWYAFLGDE